MSSHSESRQLPAIHPDRLQRLFEVGLANWEDFRERRGEHFHPFVPADYQGAYNALRQLAPHAHSFLEFGSGIGVITIMADMLGMSACGIEIDPWLTERATDMAEDFESNARFVCGSFVPHEFQDALTHDEDDEYLTIAEGPPAYDELGQDLSDFDIVYAFPWPGTERLLFRMMQRCGRPDTLLLTYDGTDGFRLYRDTKEVTLAKPWS